MTAQSFRRLLVLAAVLTLGVAAGASARSGAANPSSQAAQLVGRASGAKTSAARYQAVLDIAKAIGLPVFTATGKSVTPGSRAVPARFNLYDFQLQAAVASLSRHDSMTIAGLAQLYAQAGAKISGATLATRLQAGIAATAARPAAPSSLLGLIVRDLGLHHHPASDLARSATPTTELDPLQALLIAADSAVHSRSGRLLAVSSATQAGPCEGSTEPGTAPAPVAGAGSGSDVDLMQVLLLVQAEEITVVNTPLRETHYGPPGHSPLAGKILRLGVHVEIRYKLPTSVLCGLLAGRKFPRPGALPNAPIFWKAVDLFTYGKVEFEPANMRTGLDGNSTLVFTPKTEDFPGFGTEYKATGDVSATLGGVDTATVGLLTVSQHWTVGYHKPRGFKFELPTFSFLNTAGKDKATITVAVKGRVCGDDPFTKPWDITETVNPGAATADYPVNLFDNQNITTGAGSSLDHQWTLYDQPPGSISPLKLRLTITPGSPANGTFSPSSDTKEAYVFEDKSCPDNSEGG
jgi:hypothetical protein